MTPPGLFTRGAFGNPNNPFTPFPFQLPSRSGISIPCWFRFRCRLMVAGSVFIVLLSRKCDGKTKFVSLKSKSCESIFVVTLLLPLPRPSSSLPAHSHHNIIITYTLITATAQKFVKPSLLSQHPACIHPPSHTVSYKMYARDLMNGISKFIMCIMF